MVFVTLVLCGLLLSGVFLAARELVGFEPSAEWRDVGKLRERLSGPLQALPATAKGNRSATIRHCLSLRDEFTRAWRLCRFLAPIMGDAGYVGTLMVTRARFHAVLGLALVCGAAGCTGCCASCMEMLRRMSEAMRSSALLILMHSDLDTGFSAA